jgi:hypothetical protein
LSNKLLSNCFQKLNARLHPNEDLINLFPSLSALRRSSDQEEKKVSSDPDLLFSKTLGKFFYSPLRYHMTPFDQEQCANYSTNLNKLSVALYSLLNQEGMTDHPERARFEKLHRILISWTKSGF